MSDRPQTTEGRSIGGWVLRGDPGGFDVAGTLATFGRVFRFPLEANERTELMDAGQPCFLYSGDTSKVVGIWAIGEVVAPTTLVELDADDGAGGGAEVVSSQLYAEVELLPLVKPLAVDQLRKHPVLAESQLLTSSDAANPLVLRPEEVRAIEELDFAFAEPTEEQLARLDEVLGADDGMVLQLIGLDRSFGIMDDGGDDGLLSVVTVSDDGAFELGRFQEFVDALDLVRLQAADLELDEPVPVTDGAPDGDPSAVLQVEDGVLALYRTGPTAFDLWELGDGADAETVGRFESLDAALAGIGEAIEDDTDEDDTDKDDSDKDDSGSARG